MSEWQVLLHVSSIQRARVSFLLKLCEDLLLRLYLNVSSIQGKCTLCVVCEQQVVFPVIKVYKGLRYFVCMSTM